jgi:hypothetical protein
VSEELAACLHDGYHQPGRCPEANAIASDVDSAGIGGPAPAVTGGRDPYVSTLVVVGPGDHIVVDAFRGSTQTIGAVRLGWCSIQSREAEAFLELAEAARAAASRIGALAAERGSR